jgi:hypothetical protein
MHDVSRLAGKFHDAALMPELWPDALASLANALGSVGAAYIVLNPQTGQVDWACFAGPSVALKPDYISHYSALDPYAPLLPTGSWLRLTDCLPSAALRKDPWYNEFVLRCGVGDLVGTRLINGRANSVIFGVHHARGRGTFPREAVAVLKELFEPLRRAARSHAELRRLGWRSHAGFAALDQLSVGVIIAERDGRVLDMNPLAEIVMTRNDGLTIQDGRLVASHPAENEELHRAIFNAGRNGLGQGMVRLKAGGHRQPGYSVTVTSLPAHLGFFERALVMVLVNRTADASR